MSKKVVLYLLACRLTLLLGHAQATQVLWLDDLPIQTYSEGIRPVAAKTNYSHDSLSMLGQKYHRGLGAQSPCVLAFYLNGHAKRFKAVIGPDDQGRQDTPITFYVLGDKKVLFKSHPMKVGDKPIPVDVDLAGIQRFGLLVTDTVGGIRNKRTYADWANAQFEMNGPYQPDYIPNDDNKYILTPAEKEMPRINSAKIFGATPGHPFLYTIASTGIRPMEFSAENLPQGLTLSSQTGIISGTVSVKGTYEVTLKAKNRVGEAAQKLIVKIGDTIALTPPIGWNGWNAWERKIDRQKVIEAANAMVSTGLRNHGWTYINIDDAWQGSRGGPDTALQPNDKFPDFKSMVDHIHSLGLKAGLYSTPYISSYAGYLGGSSEFPKGGELPEVVQRNRQPYMHIGSYRFETNDARQMAAWGFDFLKYDWRIDVNSAERMSSALKNSGRDIIFSLSNNAPFEKVNDWSRLANMYRTGPDIKDSWNSLFMNTFSLDPWGPYTGPGHWADPDMMILGKVSIGPVLHSTRLTPDEQYSHVSMFSLLAAPLLIGCPLYQLDAFTLSLLTNDEVIAINQDPLGKAARLIADKDGIQTWLKLLEDGSYAVGLFNIDGYGTIPQSYFRWGDEKPKSFKFDFKTIGLPGKWKVRDVWRQKDLGSRNASIRTSIPHHGAVLWRLIPK